MQMEFKRSALGKLRRDQSKMNEQVMNEHGSNTEAINQYNSANIMQVLPIFVVTWPTCVKIVKLANNSVFITLIETGSCGCLCEGVNQLGL